MDLQDKIDRLKSVPDDLVSAMGKVENDAMRKVLGLIESLETESGIILNNSFNLSLISAIEQELKGAIFSNSYYKSLANFSSEFQVQASLNNAYFASIIDDFVVLKDFTKVMEASRNSALSLLSEDAFSQALIKPIQDSLLSSVIGGGSITDTLKSIRQIVIGSNDVDGRLISHVKRVAYDAFAIADRQYTQAVGNHHKFEWFQWFGGKVSDSRCFCIEHHGKYFHRKEIEGFGEGLGIGNCSVYSSKLLRNGWQGMNENTTKITIWSYAGGYFCKHSILPVSQFVVPKEVIQRNIDSGNYQEAA